MTRAIHLRCPGFRMLLLAALAGGAAGCAGTRPFEKPQGPHIRVLTYNVNYGGPAPRSGLEAIQEAKADIICLQETTPDWERVLRPGLAEDHPHVLFRHRGAAGGQGVFSRWPLAETAFVRPEAGWFHAWILEAKTPIGPVQILSVHLRPPASDKGRFTASAYFATKQVRLQEVRDLHARLKPGVPTLLLGDFNENDGGPPLKWLQQKGYTDALREFDRRTATWRWPTRYLTLRARLDHILYSRDLHALEARVIQKGGSDHFPLLGVFERRRSHP